MEIEMVATSDFAMEYFRFGRGEKVLAVLPGLSVHSVMGFAGAVAGAYKPLANDFVIYILDRRKDPPVGYSVRDMAKDTADALRALGLEQVCLMGVSQGGMIAMSIASECPDLVRKLVLCSTSARMTSARYSVIEEWVELAKAGDASGLYLAFGESIYPRSMFEKSRNLLEKLAATVTDSDLERFIILAEGMKGFDVSDDLDKIACPVFLVGSRDDRILGADATEQIAERLRTKAGFSLHMYDGYGHAAYDTAPDYKERVLRFLLQGSTR